MIIRMSLTLHGTSLFRRLRMPSPRPQRQIYSRALTFHPCGQPTQSNPGRLLGRAAFRYHHWFKGRARSIDGSRSRIPKKPA